MFVANAVATRDGKLEAFSRWPQYMAYFDPDVVAGPLGRHDAYRSLRYCNDELQRALPHCPEIRLARPHKRRSRRVEFVTSSNVSEAFNFGRERHYEHDARYDRAVEFVEVVKGLWDSWDDDAFVRDRNRNVTLIRPSSII